MIGRLAGGLVIALVAGVLTGLFGVGGGFLITPMLSIVLGLPMPLAVGTGVLNILGTTTSNLYWRRKSNLADYKLAAVLFGGNAMGAYLGANVLERWRLAGDLTIRGSRVAAADLYTLIVYLLVLSLIFMWMAFETRRPTPATPRIGLFARLRLPPYARFESLEGPALSIPLLSYFGLLLGFLTGLLGVGGGVLLLPALVYLVGMRTHAAIVTSSVMVWLTSLVAGVSHASAGNVDLMLLLVLLLGGTIGAQVGLVLCNRLSGARLRQYFAYVVLGVVVMVAIRLAGILI
ncbi:MAG: sulfite exporter TauE/SafE family protein [Chloroflexi bacterium]|nr:sulfite exporter TauE/SafE family protein [Chloroflexota bacterium]